MPSRRAVHQPKCTIVHKLLNNLSVIIGNCDLLIEKTEEGTEYADRLAVIREAAQTAAERITEHQRQGEVESGKTERRKAS